MSEESKCDKVCVDVSDNASSKVCVFFIKDVSSKHNII